MTSRALLLALALPVLGCATLRPTPAPMPALRLDTAPDARCMLVLLPGRWDDPEDFHRRGFVQAALETGVPLRIVTPDAHIGYYAKRSVVERLHADVVLPALEAGVERVWFAGVSLGGLGSILYARDHPDVVSGAVALAPYLGGAELLAEIEAAGGLAAWRPSPVSQASFADLWEWLRGYSESRPAHPPLFLGYGRGDDLARAGRLLGATLPGERVFVVDGGHDWDAWSALWDRFLATGALQRSCVSR